MTYGAKGILGEEASYLLTKTAYAHDCRGSEVLMPALQVADLAWALTLQKANLLKNGDALIEALVALKTFEINPKYGDLYNCKNVALKKLGHAARELHLCRPRREAINLAFYLKLKERLGFLESTMKSLGETFVKVARKERKTLMPDLTYLQHAQPTTFGHYVLTFLYPMLREFERLEVLKKQLDRSPAGVGSVNGCALPIDRLFLARLLAFEELEPHARDAMWRSDLPLAAMGILASLMANLNRWVEELIIFATEEFDTVRLPGSLSRASVIMPNKQNPYPLTYFRGLTNELTGKLAAYMSYEKEPSGHPDSRTFVYVDLIESITRVAEALKLLEMVMQQMRVNKKILEQRVKESFFYATDIAEWLVVNRGLDYETAHEEVGRVIRHMRKNGLRPSQIEANFFEYPIENLDTLIDPYRSVSRKNGPGSVGDLHNLLEKADTTLRSVAPKTPAFDMMTNILKEKGYETKLAL